MNALTRRFENIAVGQPLECAALQLDCKKCEAYIFDEIVTLSAQESQLLEYLMRNPGQVLTKEQIFNKVWGFDSETEINAVELYVFYLRKKAEKKIYFIQSNHYRGYYNNRSNRDEYKSIFPKKTMKYNSPYLIRAGALPSSIWQAFLTAFTEWTSRPQTVSGWGFRSRNGS